MSESRNTAPLVLYHGNCVDGFVAAWCAWRHFEDRADYRAVEYSDLPPGDTALANREVYVLDFSFKTEWLVHAAQVATKVIVLDHHKASKLDLEAWKAKGDQLPVNLHIELDLAESGASLAWRYFFSLFSPSSVFFTPIAVQLAKDYDLWQFLLPDTRAFAAAMQMLGYVGAQNFERFDQTVRWAGEFSELLKAGKTALQVQKHMAVKVLERNAIRRWHDALQTYYVIANLPHELRDVGAELILEDKAIGFSLTYDDWRTTEVRKCSLRSRKGGVDVDALARQYAGGGHASAAGFSMPLQEFDTIDDLNEVF